jgi:hypothetical protein
MEALPCLEAFSICASISLRAETSGIDGNILVSDAFLQKSCRTALSVVIKLLESGLGPP